ncbi:MAG TPA: G1 family glutamic endopeptidase [Patescibacteria group bacterium]|nr:G1 family glutamic endopeptidase [Patescibacteria group bacterium]
MVFSSSIHAFLLGLSSLLIMTIHASSHNGFALSPDVSSNVSRNWAGYIATNGSFTSISGTWDIPSITNGNYGSDAAWVGIGGVSSNDLIQAGTQETVNRNGQVSYEAFYETLPDVSRALSITVNGGDSVTVSVTQTSNGVWQINVKDNTSGQSTQANVSYTSSLSSADWVEEAPSGMRSILPLDNFGSIQFTNLSTIENGNTDNLSQANASAVTMTSIQNQPLASVSALGSDNASFTVSRTATSSLTNITPSYRFYHRGSWVHRKHYFFYY